MPYDAQYNEDEYINVGALIRNYIRHMLRTWYVFLVLGVLCAGGLLAVKRLSLNTVYSSTVYYSVERTKDVYTDAAVTARIAAGVPAMTETADFRHEILDAMNLKELDAEYSFRAKATDSANLFSVSVVTSTPGISEDILHAFEAVFPEWVTRSVGSCTLTVTDEQATRTGIFYEWSTKKCLVVGGGIAAFIWFALITIALVRTKKVYNEDDMKQIVSSICLGMIPDIKKKERKNSTKETLLLSNENIDTGYLQSIRALRTRIERLIKKEKTQVILVTSTCPQEGKTLLTMNLATALRQHGKRVVVVDGDMRGSGISRMLKLDDNTQGLSDLMKNPTIYMSSVNKIAVMHNGTIVLPAGTSKGELTGSLKAENMNTLLDNLRKRADIILIDTPPAGYFGDAVVFSEFADGVFFIVRSDYTDVREIKKSIEPFIQSKKLYGYILNRVEKPLFGAEYGYGYRYGYGYGSKSAYYYGIDEEEKTKNSRRRVQK